MSCSTTTPDEITKLSDSTSESGALSTLLPSESSSTPAPTASATTTASGNSDHPGNETIGDESSTFNSIDTYKSTSARGGGGGANVLSLSYFAFLLTIIVHMS